jgi:hypothetical protein
MRLSTEYYHRKYYDNFEIPVITENYVNCGKFSFLYMLDIIPLEI